MNQLAASILLCLAAFSEAANVHREFRRATNNCNNTPVPNVCPQNESGITHLPHPTDANKFILCQGGRMYVVICPEGESYSNDKQDCASAPATQPPMPITDSTVTVAIVTDKPKVMPTTISANPCDVRTLTANNLYFAHPDDKTKFIQCDFSGHAYTMQCPKKLIWNQLARNCVESVIEG